jgi:N-acetylglucosaminyldiphosphoundecaprenol N-acetyl-beta-D-mannosaminyltransferase
LLFFNVNLADGQPLVWVAKLKGAKQIVRCYGPEIFSQMMMNTNKLNIKHYFFGGREGVADRLAVTCKIQFNNDKVVGTFSPPFHELSESDIKKIANDINIKKTDVLWLGVSTPKQEILAKRLSQYTNVKLIITVGAAFDYYTASIKIAPNWFQKIGLEWLYRLMSEPRRLWRRYFEIVPKFIFFGILDLIGFYRHPFERKQY